MVKEVQAKTVLRYAIANKGPLLQGLFKRQDEVHPGSGPGESLVSLADDKQPAHVPDDMSRLHALRSPGLGGYVRFDRTIVIHRSGLGILSTSRVERRDMMLVSLFGFFFLH